MAEGYFWHKNSILKINTFKNNVLKPDIMKKTYSKNILISGIFYAKTVISG